MSVVLARVDDRLLHGQIIEGWVPHVCAEMIVVASDSVCLDRSRCRLMELIVPDHIDLRVTSLENLGALLEKAAACNVLLLFADLDDVLVVLNNGIILEHVNVGNLHHLRGGTEVTPSVYLNDRDLESVRDILDRGVAVEAREVPDGKALDLSNYLERSDGTR